MIDGMVSVLKDENVADIQMRAQCKDQYQRIEGTVKFEKNIAKIDKLAKQIEHSEEEKARTVEQIKEAVQRMRNVTKQCECDNTAVS